MFSLCAILFSLSSLIPLPLCISLQSLTTTDEYINKKKPPCHFSSRHTHTHRRWHGNRFFYCFTFLYRTDHQRQEKPASFSSLSPLNSKSNKKRRRHDQTNDEYSLKRRFLSLTAFEYQSNTSMFRLSYSTRACGVIWDIDRSSRSVVNLKRKILGVRMKLHLDSFPSSSGKPRRAKPYDYCLVTLNQI